MSAENLPETKELHPFGMARLPQSDIAPSLPKKAMSAGLLTKNLGGFLKNVGTSMFQNTDLLKTDSLLIASLVLVFSRILVANVSAVRARGSSEGPYRYRESIRTDIREVLGWTFSFAVLRQIQNWVSKKLMKPLGISKVGEPQKYPFWENLRAALTEKGPAPFSWDWAKREGLHYDAQAASPKMIKMLKETPILKDIFNKLGKNEAERVKMFFKAGPLVLGSVGATLLGGYALERFTRDYSDHVVDLVSRTFKKNTPPAAPIPPQLATGPYGHEHTEASREQTLNFMSKSLPIIHPLSAQSVAVNSPLTAIKIPVRPVLPQRSYPTSFQIYQSS